MKKRKFNKIISMILCVVCALATIVNPSDSKAASQDELVVYESHDDVATYRADKSYPDAEAEGDYVFAGWYYLDGTTYKPYGVGGADNATIAFAKFVDAKVLGAKLQLTSGTTSESAKTDIRLVTSVDSLDYSSVGFHVTFNSKTILCSSTKVYASINAVVNGQSEAIDPTVFSDTSAFFATHRITGVPNNAFDKEWMVQPTWTTLDGTTVVARASEVKIITVDELVEEPYVVDFENGVNFEHAADLGVITTYNGSNGWSGLWGANLANASLESFNGSTQLAVTPAGDSSGGAWPTFFVSLGKTYPAGTVLTFECYYNSNGGSDGQLWEYSTAGSVSAPYRFVAGGRDTTTITYILSNACDRVAIQATTWGDTMYYDNFQLQPPIDFEVGVDFEQDSHLAVISTYNGSNGWPGLWGPNTSNASLESFNGSTQLAVTPATSGEAWPTFFVNLGKTYPAGTVFTFECYYNSGGVSTVKLWDYSTAGYVSLEASYWVTAKETTTITYALQSECDRVAIQYSTWGDAAYFDNFLVVAPIDFEYGVDFEESRDADVVSASTGSDALYGGEWGPHATEVSRVMFGDSNVIMATPKSFVDGAAYPTIHVDFGKTYPAGSVLTYRVYIEDGTGYTEWKLREYQAGSSGMSGEHYFVTQRGTWVTQRIVLESACNRISIFATVYNQTAKIYFDDFLIDANVASLYTAVTTGQKMYFGAITQENALETRLYDANKNLLRTVNKEELSLVESFGSSYGIYCYTVNSDDVKYVYTPHDVRGSLFALLLKNANDTATSEEIVEEFIAMFGIDTPSTEAINKLSGKTALFVGHSIQEGMTDYHSIYSCRAWAGRIGYYYGMNVENVALSGACVSNARESEVANLYFYNQLKSTEGKQYDYVIIQGFVNDPWQYPQVTVGTSQSGTKEDFDISKVDESKFADAMELLFYTARQQNPNAKLGYIIDYDLGVANSEEYVTIAIALCEKWGVEYLDLYHDTGFEIELSDGVHPTTKGYDTNYTKIGDWMAEM